MLREGVKKIINEEEDMCVVGEAGDGLELLDLLSEITADLAIIDISMPNLGGIETVKKIKEAYPDIKTLILSMHKEKEYLYHALIAGADGYLLKDDTGPEMFTAIQAIRQGGNYISPYFSEEVVRDLAASLKGKSEPLIDSLTKREREVLKLVAEGKTSKQIANELFISSRTVEHHRASMTKKLDISTLSDLIKYAIQKGYISS
jgi:DNA-binding NarL/FixJ family response regulator